MSNLEIELMMMDLATGRGAPGSAIPGPCCVVAVALAAAYFVLWIRWRTLQGLLRLLGPRPIVIVGLSLRFAVALLLLAAGGLALVLRR